MNTQPTAAENLRRLADLLETKNEVLSYSVKEQLGEPISVGLDGRPEFSRRLVITVEYLAEYHAKPD